MDTTHDARTDLTLGAMLRSVAYTRLPTQFYQLLQLAIPFAFQFWSYGLYRTAGWMVVMSLFGLWALCEQRLDGAGRDGAVHGAGYAWTRIARSVAGGAAAALAGLLALEAFVQFMTLVFRCPGCAG